MCNRGLDSNGSQFFFTFAAKPEWDERHVVFGVLRNRESLRTLFAIDQVGSCVEIKFHGALVLNHRVDLHATDATPARWRGDVGSSPLDGASAATSSPRNDLV